MTAVLEPVDQLNLTGRDLICGEIEVLVASIAEDPSSWGHLVAFDSEDRVYVSLHRDSYVDIWLLCWTPENDTGWRDHDVFAGAVARERRVAEGELRSFVADHIHRLSGAVHGSVSVHAYSPPL